MAVSILHLTDIHFSLNRNTVIMGAIQQEFTTDLRYIIQTIGGRIDVIVFSGDLAFSGDYDQYVLAEQFFKSLGTVILEETGSVPPLFAVPGNHDVDRQALGLATLPKMVEGIWEEIAEDFWRADGDGFRKLVQDGFASYSAWWQSPGLPIPGGVIDGLMSGDHAATVKTATFTLGVLGLNTAIRHLSDRVKPGHLSVNPTQIAKACGGDVFRWAKQHDLCVLITHHPFEWLDTKSQLLLGELLFTSQNPFRLHLSGHLHTAAAGIGDHLAMSEYERLQGRSLFGLESLPSGETRSHGYQIVQLNDDATAFRVWPRSATRTPGGAWNLGPDGTLGMPKGRESTDWRTFARSVRRRSATARSVEESVPALRESLPQRDIHEARGAARPESPAAAEGVPAPSREDYMGQLLKDFATGTVRLVLGDDLSSTTAPGAPFSETAGVRALQRDLQIVALGSVPTESGRVRLDELLKLARRSKNKEIRPMISAAAADLSDEWSSTRRRILSGPWPVVVDLWIADDSARQQDFDPPKRTIVTASEDFTLDDAILLVKMNGRPSDPDTITFDTPAVISQSNRRLWLQRLSIDFVRSPVLYIADDVDELGLWEYIELRGSEACSQPNVPTGYLVCPDLTPVQVATLFLYKVRWIESSVRDFVATALDPSREEVATGKRRLRASLEIREHAQSGPRNVRELREHAGNGGPDVLLGREPSWGDAVQGFTIRLSAVDYLHNALSSPKSRVLLIHGTAGCGKSTALMHLALELDADGMSVLWIDRSTDLRVGQILDRVKASSPDYVIVDNVDVYGVFGAKAAHVLHSVGRTTTVVAAVRSNQLTRLDVGNDFEQRQMPDLSQADIWLILEALGKRGLLGKLRGMAIADRYQTLAHESGRQLLVALMQATRGRRFSEILESEYAELNSLQQFTYVLACIVSGLNEVGIAVRELEMAAGGYGVDARKATDVLLKSRLLVSHPDGLLSPRHRVIGEAILGAVQRKGELLGAILPLLQTLTISARATKDTSRRDRRLLIRLINHDQLGKFGLDLSEARTLYGSVQNDLYDDFHFWLQRGTYELERGDLEYALNYLEQARLVEGGHDDPYVLTEFSLARLRAALATSDVASAVGLGEEALADLARVIRVQGVRSPHTVVVLATAGLDWIERVEIGPSLRVKYARETKELLNLVQDVAEESEYADRTLKSASKRLSAIVGL